jgi:hypothetical protein
MVAMELRTGPVSKDLLERRAAAAADAERSNSLNRSLR